MKLIPLEHRNKLKKREESIISPSKLPIETMKNSLIVEEKPKVEAAEPEP